MSKNKPFIPRDKPKSWVIFIISVLCALLVASPLMITGIFLHIEIIEKIGSFLFYASWVLAAIMFFVGILSRISGNWKNVEERDWKDQVW